MNLAFESRQIFVNGLNVHVVIEGEGPDVLLVHGFPDTHQVWRKQIPALVAAGYRVIAPDNRGCGQSDIPTQLQEYRAERFVSDLVGLLDALQVRKVRLVGHDLGSVMSWLLCMQYPERVERYMTLSVGHISAYTRAPLEQKLRAYYMLLFQARGLVEWALRTHDWWLTRAVSGYPSECPLWIESLSRPGRLTAAINFYRANLRLLLPCALPKPAVPILGVWSSGDRFLVEAQMRNSANWVAGPWRYVRIDGASHWLQLDAAEQINRLMIEFFR